MPSATRFIIIVGTDYSEMAGQAVDRALELATLHDGAEVHLVYVAPTPVVAGSDDAWREGSPAADAALKQLQGNAVEHLQRLQKLVATSRIRRVVVHVRHGSPAQNIAQLAADLDADAVVVGSHGAHGIQRVLLGSVAEHVSHLARCPVWIVRPKAHTTVGRVPEIEPPCPDCLVAREQSGGADLWCARHAEHHIRAHGYAYTSEGIYGPDTTAYASTPGQG